jgi:hypothetical protein
MVQEELDAVGLHDVACLHDSLTLQDAKLEESEEDDELL